MNERIRELAEQAGLKYHNWITNESNINDGDFKYPRLEDYEKFAELIVKECMRMCEVAQVGYLTHGLEKEASGAFSVKQYIEEYLGVDE
jgi:hypothetical protein